MRGLSVARALRPNALALVGVAVLATGLVGGLDLHATIATLGAAFTKGRYVTAVWIVLPLIGLLEHAGLRERAASLIAGLRGATTGRILVAYLLLRQGSAALGLTSIAGQAQTVRPLIAPMAEAATPNADASTRARIRAHAAATDNIGLFFGEDIFIAISSILLIRAFLGEYGINVAPLALSVWAIPTAIAAFLVHGARLWRLDRRGWR